MDVEQPDNDYWKIMILVIEQINLLEKVISKTFEDPRFLLLLIHKD